MSDKPTGVFVRLPLDEAQIMKLYNPKKSGNENLLAIGTPVTGGKLKIVGYAPSHLEGGWCAIFRKKSDALKSSIPLVRQSDVQAHIAALEAEVVRLREYYEACEAIFETGVINSTPEMFRRKDRSRESLKGGS
ncbi:hypothetical protein ASY01nite_14380 [Acetobacter syzygii]|uniref:hypothetical protein n=1 Tax=Acetobacter syzygii TaxID=146476 RepID=UPI0005DFBF16|nr:hypothetical protein [Acetobacter syzygii]GAN72151.1 hypothetical protein Absy_030_059 [Acetobacter syzygii]GBR64998.1 hypothetical protein AA0483_1640 [Acetobacter syzygii NRIC 0483]GEL56372.1 hypothetical protein ASY01nite_14380 [Acetobacter syzygii]